MRKRIGTVLCFVARGRLVSQDFIKFRYSYRRGLQILRFTLTSPSHISRTMRRTSSTLATFRTSPACVLSRSGGSGRLSTTIRCRCPVLRRVRIRYDRFQCYAPLVDQSLMSVIDRLPSRTSVSKCSHCRGVDTTHGEKTGISPLAEGCCAILRRARSATY